MQKSYLNRSLIMLVILFCSVSVYAAPPVVQVGTGAVSGIEIAYPEFQYMKQNTNFTFDIHLFNVSNGLPLYQRPSCYIDLYSPTGSHTLKSKLFSKPASAPNDEEVLIDKSNFSIIGLNTFTVWCNNTAHSKGGFVNGGFTVVKDTLLYRLTDNNELFAFVLIGLLFAIAIFLLYFSNQFKLEGENFVVSLSKFIINMLLKLLSIATIVYSIMITRNSIPEITNVVKVFDSYMLLFFWSMALFFIVYVVHQCVVLVENFKIKKQNEKKRYG